MLDALHYPPEEIEMVADLRFDSHGHGPVATSHISWFGVAISLSAVVAAFAFAMSWKISQGEKEHWKQPFVDEQEAF